MAENRESREGAAGGWGGQSMEAGIPSAVAEIMRNVIATARVEAAFGKPHAEGNRTVIPVADVMVGTGFGMGSGSGPEGTGGGAGSGGGAGARSRPIAVVVVGPEGVEIRPVLDLSRLYLAAIATVGFSLLWFVRLFAMSKVGEPKAKDLPTAKSFRKLVARSD